LRINILTNPHKRTKSLDALNKRFYRYKKILNLKKNNISGDKIQALANNYFLYKTVNAKKNNQEVTKNTSDKICLHNPEKIRIYYYHKDKLLYHKIFMVSS